ncbi:SGNH/GDSL hydrolase family protein [Agrobacterium salinitolerans]|uniref:SGNH/GDSL hydrolase family protein n=1 Tax=Agrobacterium salinitolerans TaxID=1183413 RepID=A0A4Z1QXX5_9HYPH|nr:SGNH/GDSL hydrolase family protein [Agrobacterium salinitolerans]UYZ08534.1 SGNH/GDSL hydrolase family protein [Agrobacterium salinitolerans]
MGSYGYGFKNGLPLVTGRKRALPNAFGPLRQKLEAGQNVVIFVNGDSTAYSDFGIYYLFAKMLGDKYNATVIMRRWAEYDSVGGTWTGPKDYAAPVTLKAGTAQTISVYLAAIPGKVAGTIFDGSRKPKAIDAIPLPDICITHHGHNMQSFPTIAGATGLSFYSNGLGKWLGPIGMMELQWPDVPQLVTAQNPWKDYSDAYKMYNAIKFAVQAHEGLSFVDTYTPFIALGNASGLFRGGDNIHPSDSEANHAGAQLQADTLLSAFNAAPARPFSTPAWPLKSAANLIDNGDFSNWPGALPVGWTAAGSGLAVAKETGIKYGAAPYSCKITPSTGGSGQASYLQKYLSAQEMARIAGKTVCFAALCYSVRPQVNPATYFSVKNAFGNVRDYVTGAVMDCQDGWMWYMSVGIPIVNDPNEAWRYLRLIPSQQVPNPATSDPLIVQRVLITEGLPPKGLIAA